MRRRLVLSGLAGALLPARPAAACALREQGRVPVEIVGGSLCVEVKINGHPARMILDTGAQRTLIQTAALQRLELEQDSSAAASVRGIGGIERHLIALPCSLSLGGVALARRTLARDMSLTVGTLARPGIGTATGSAQPVDGLLGRDLLSAFDLDLDLRARSLGLFAVTDCRSVVPPWGGGFITVPTQAPMDTAIQLAIDIDGTGLRALLDTGAAATVIAAPGMARLGVSPALLEQDRKITLSGVGPRITEARLHRFRTLRVGDITIADPRILMAPIQVIPIVDVLLGSDFLINRRTWISFATRQLHITPA